MNATGQATKQETGVVSQSNRAPESRLIVSCGDAGVASDYCKFLNESSVCRTALAAGSESQTPAASVMRLMRSDTEFKQLTAEEFTSHSCDTPFCTHEVVVFLEPGVTSRTMSVFAKLSQLSMRNHVGCLIVVPSLKNHLADSRCDDLQPLLDKLGDVFRQRNSTTSSPSENSGPGLVILRTGYVLSPSSSLTRRSRSLSGFKRILSDRMTTTFVEGRKLFAAINEELRNHRRRIETGSRQARDVNPQITTGTAKPSGDLRPPLTEGGGNLSSVRQITLLGGRRSWKDVVSDSEGSGTLNRAMDRISAVMSCVGLPWLLFVGLRVWSRFIPSIRQLHFETLKPRSVRELISLYNKHNCDDVQIAGSNNGVNHFGWKFPSKTVVLTTGVPGKTRLSNASILDLESRIRSSDLSPAPKSRNMLASRGQNETDTSAFRLNDSDESQQATSFTVDAGLTLNHCIRELNKVDREFYVVPNYSWISMGTLFFVPVHGSGSRVSTLGDTIEAVLLYDGDEARFVLARRGDTIFREAMYNTRRHLLLLRLTLRVKPKSKYFVRRSTMENPSADEVQQLFDDQEASNVEIRKNQAASTAIDVSRYYIDTVADGQNTMEMPRDSIGRVWDRLEETPIVSPLFHWFVRTFAFHVELFLKPDEFAIFWEHHRSLPVSKIQLRRVLKDGITHSACEHHDCISADLFMTRRNRDVFCQFVATHLPHVRSNPGKQSL